MARQESPDLDNAFHAHIESATNVVLGIDLEHYRPIEQLSHYGQFVVSHTGTYTATPPLPTHIATFIRELHRDLGLWDGTVGTFGRDYLTHRPSGDRITAAQIDDYRMRYKQLIADTTPRAMLEQLRRTIEKQSRIQGQLRQAVQDVQRRMDKLRRQRDRLEIDEGPSSERVQDLDDRLAYDEDELNTLRAAEKQIKQRLLQSELELSERETGHVRRIALLRRIFGEEPLRGGLLLPYSADAEYKSSLVNKCDQIAMRTSKLLLDAKCFYLDAVVAKMYLYKLETTLRSILENLRQAVDIINTPSLNHSSTPGFLSRTFSTNNNSSPVVGKRKSHHGDNSPENGGVAKQKCSESSPTGGFHRRLGERGPDFRIRYVRKLWNSLEADYKSTLPYITTTSLQLALSKVQAINGGNSNGTEHELQKQNSERPLLHIALTKMRSMGTGHNMNNNMNGDENKLLKTPSLSLKNPADKYGTFGVFHHGAPLLPRFATIELTHALNKRARLSALHKSAAKAYKEVNTVYDLHEDLVQKALTLLQKRMTEDRKANEQLISKWEDLLGVSG